LKAGPYAVGPDPGHEHTMVCWCGVAGSLLRGAPIHQHVAFVQLLVREHLANRESRGTTRWQQTGDRGDHYHGGQPDEHTLCREDEV
jgi:hypothetical protein